MSFIDKIVSAFAPHHCLGCGVEGDLLCVSCFDNLRPPIVSCYRCSRFTEASKTCIECRAATPLLSARPAVKYEGLAKELVHCLKFSGAQAATRAMAKHMINSHEDLLKNTELLIVPVPTATSRVRQRGYDQAKLLAKELAWQAKAPYLDCLVRVGQSRQVGASRSERLRQLEHTFRIHKSRYIKNNTILLVDDVMTTGATLHAAAQILVRVGAAHVEAITFAKA